MDISFDEEQGIAPFQHSAVSREQYDFDERRKIVATDEGWSRSTGNHCRTRTVCAAPFQESSAALAGGSPRR